MIASIFLQLHFFSATMNLKNADALIFFNRIAYFFYLCHDAGHDVVLCIPNHLLE